MPELDAVERRIIDALQGDFPVCEHPYGEAAARLGQALQQKDTSVTVDLSDT